MTHVFKITIQPYYPTVAHIRLCLVAHFKLRFLLILHMYKGMRGVLHNVCRIGNCLVKWEIKLWCTILGLSKIIKCIQLQFCFAPVLRFLYKVSSHARFKKQQILSWTTLQYTTTINVALISFTDLALMCYLTKVLAHSLAVIIF